MIKRLRKDQDQEDFKTRKFDRNWADFLEPVLPCRLVDANEQKSLRPVNVRFTHFNSMGLVFL